LAGGTLGVYGGKALLPQLFGDVQVETEESQRSALIWTF
jgi:hypothetical protein